MDNRITHKGNSREDARFKTISEFKLSIQCGREIELEWKGIHVCIMRYGDDEELTIYLANRPETERIFSSTDHALEYMVARTGSGTSSQKQPSFGATFEM